MAALDDSPLPVVTSQGFMVILTGNDIRKLVGVALYDPIKFFKPLANTLHQAMTGNTTGLITSMISQDLIPDLDNVCSAKHNPSFRPEARSAVLCSDGDDLTSKDAA